jgi:hypothetical protein
MERIREPTEPSGYSPFARRSRHHPSHFSFAVYLRGCTGRGQGPLVDSESTLENGIAGAHFGAALLKSLQDNPRCRSVNHATVLLSSYNCVIEPIMC